MNSTTYKTLVLLTTFSLYSFNGTYAQTSSPIQAEVVNSTHVKTSSRKSPAPEPTSFLRLTKDKEGNVQTLQTSVTRYKSSDGKILVDLIGAVHIGEGEYYRKLNHQFSQYESLLYELVAPQGTQIPFGGRKQGGANPISWLQSSAQKMLGLESQLEKIDYTKRNFVHADMSPSEISSKMRERGENAFTIGLSAISEMMKKHGSSQGQETSGQATSFSEMMELMSNPLELKKMMARQFTEAGAMDLGMGKKINQILITDRNEAAIKVLTKQIVSGKTKIGIFYGAAHMPDFAKRLTEDLGLKQTHHVWVDAWDLTRAPAPSESANPSGLFKKLLKALDQ